MCFLYGQTYGQCKKYKHSSYIRRENLGGRMMMTLKLLTQQYPEKVEAKIKKLIDIEEMQNKHYVSEQLEGLTSFQFNYQKREKEAILQKVANIASDIVQEGVIKKVTKKYLDAQSDLTKKDKLTIEELFINNNYIAKEDGVSYISYYVVYVPILKELEKYEQLHLEGWIDFRTKKYQRILEDLLEEMVCDYKTEKEYLECISLLIQSRSYQQAIESTLHLVPSTYGQMSILNSKKEEVTKAYIQKYCKELLEDEPVQIEDLLMNIFLTVAPQNIVIHNKESYANKQFVSTLELIFEGHTTYCEGCAYCNRAKEDETY